MELEPFWAKLDEKLDRQPEVDYTESMLESYVQYLQQVLGIQSYILPETHTPDTAPCLFLSDASPLTQAESELFLKMTAAMKLSQDQFRLYNLQEKDVSHLTNVIQSAQVIISFDAHLANYLQIQFPHHEIFCISHPREMLQNPNLKKDAWGKLQDAMKILSASKL